MKLSRHLYHFNELLFVDGNIDRILWLMRSWGFSNHRFTTSIKIDGSPAMVMGMDLGSPFVATKSYFNQSPVIFKTEKSIKDSVSDVHLQKKLILGLDASNKLKPKKTLIGDYLFCKNDIQRAPEHIISSQGLLSYFQPNKLAYFTSYDISVYDMGIFFHSIIDDDGVKLFNISIEKYIESAFHNLYWVRSPKYPGVPNDWMIDIMNEFSKERYSYNSILKGIEEYDSEIITICNICYRNKTFPWFAFEETAKEYFDNKMLSSSSSSAIVKFKEKQDAILNFNWEYIGSILEKIDRFKNMMIGSLNDSFSGFNDFYPYYLTKRDEFIRAEHEGFVIQELTTRLSLKLVDQTSFSYVNFNSEFVRGFDK